MRTNRPRIGVIPIGDIHEMAPKVVAAHISGYLDCQATLLEPMANPYYALDEQRLQYDVGPILEHLESKSFTSVDKVVGILDVDLFVPVFTHVFGEARQGGHVALLSTFRLKENAQDTINESTLVLERAAKVALHELCHLFDLVHCENRQCLMHFSGSLQDLDQGSFNLCRYCQRYFNDGVQ